MYNEVSKIVDWSNAPKLNVRIDYPPEWGTSNPPRGDITPTRDIRKGYEFSVEFTVTPGSLYMVKSWQVFYTSELYDPELGNWLEDTSLITQVTPLDENEVTYTTEDNRTYKFIINTTEPVTLVPWCEMSTRITKTTPHNRLDPPVSRASGIVIYFNGALNADTVKFADAENEDGIWITSKQADSTAEAPNKDGDKYLWYYPPVYTVSNGFFMITMDVKTTLPPENSLMTVKVKGIKDTDGAEVDEYSFSWMTRDRSDVSTWSAEYKHSDNNNSGPIEIEYEADNSYEVKTFYRLDKGAKKEFTGNKIDYVSGLDDSGIRERRQASGIQEYEIFIELNKDGKVTDFTSFKIWNIPGMKVSNTYPMVEVRTTAELADIGDNLSGQYVLANDITVTGAWTPIGANTSPFTGKLYGNGNTVTMKNGFAANSAADIGLFGVISGGLINGLTVVYENVTVNSGVNVGGIAGQIQNGTSILNCAVKSASVTDTLTLTKSGNDGAYLGGITGKATDSFISNCLAGLNVKLTRSGGIGNVGAVAGFTNGGSGGSITIDISSPWEDSDNIIIDHQAIDKVTVTAKVSGITSGGTLNIGGAVGCSLGNTMNNVIVSGEVSFGRTSITGGTVVGGVTGYAENSNMEACYFTSFADKAISGTIDDLKNIYVQLGGLIGRYETNIGEVYINNCLVRGNIEINENNYSGNRFGSGIEIGGVLGVSEYAEGKVNITNSFFEEGNIEANCSSSSIQAGGFCGTFYEGAKVQTDNSHYLNNCGVMSGTVAINVKNYGRYITVGGFTSTIWLKGNTSNCFSRANVISKGCGNNDEENGISDDGDNPYTYTHQAGGFAGGLAAGSTLTSCYATGTVQAEHSGNRDLSAGGLVGNSGGTIENCYALGNVLADKIAGDNSDYHSYAGGLVGSTYGGGIVQNSFSAGQVIAQSKESQAFAGGVVGNLWETTIKNTAALGKSVTALGDGRSAGRITSYSTGANNYALKTMSIEEDDYDSISPDTREANEGEDYSLAPYDTTRDGKDTDANVFFTQDFWRTLFEDLSKWDFSRAAKDGYPRLKNIEGQ
ncbi:GLUG motif-containing protein [Treponema sp. R80B11-R83G3]